MEPEITFEDCMINQELLLKKPELFTINEPLGFNPFSFKPTYFMELASYDKRFYFKDTLTQEASSITIGREEGNRWNIKDQKKVVSRYQAKLILEADRVYLKNLSTINFTAYVLKDATLLKNNDIIKIANVDDTIKIIMKEESKDGKFEWEYEVHKGDKDGKEDKEDSETRKEKFNLKENNNTIYIEDSMFWNKNEKGKKLAKIYYEEQMLKIKVMEKGSILMHLLPESGNPNDKYAVGDRESLFFGDIEFTLTKTVI